MLNCARAAGLATIARVWRAAPKEGYLENTFTMCAARRRPRRRFLRHELSGCAVPLPLVPLASYRAFSAATVKELHAAVESRLGSVCLAAPTERPIDALGNRFATLSFGSG